MHSTLRLINRKFVQELVGSNSRGCGWSLLILESVQSLNLRAVGCNAEEGLLEAVVPFLEKLTDTGIRYCVLRELVHILCIDSGEGILVCQIPSSVPEASRLEVLLTSFR